MTGETNSFVLHLGDALEVLRSFPDESIDSVVTDPPYGLGRAPDALDMLKNWLDTGHHDIKGKGFMGHDWDAFVPQPVLWKECLRVLKPGGHLLSFAGTRTYDLVVLGLRIAGFEIRDQIAWVYGNGYPKSRNLDSEREGWGTALKPAMEPIVLARKPLVGTVAQNVDRFGTGALNIDGCRVPSPGGIGRFGEESQNRRYNETGATNFAMKPGPRGGDPKGRWPANFVHGGSGGVSGDKSRGIHPTENGAVRKSVLLWGNASQIGMERLRRFRFCVPVLLLRQGHPEGQT